MAQTYTDAAAAAIPSRDTDAARLQISSERNIPSEQVSTSMANLRVQSNLASNPNWNAPLNVGGVTMPPVNTNPIITSPTPSAPSVSIPDYWHPADHWGWPVTTPDGGKIYYNPNDGYGNYRPNSNGQMQFPADAVVVYPNGKAITGAQWYYETYYPGQTSEYKDRISDIANAPVSVTPITEKANDFVTPPLVDGKVTFTLTAEQIATLKDMSAQSKKYSDKYQSIMNGKDAYANSIAARQGSDAAWAYQQSIASKGILADMATRTLNYADPNYAGDAQGAWAQLVRAGVLPPPNGVVFTK